MVRFQMFEYKDLIKQKLIREKTYNQGPYKGLSVLKYTKKAFFGGIWDERLVECRGLVIDENKNIILYPFTKVFNFGEPGINKEKTLVDRDKKVIAINKINGFMASASLYNNELLVATTGTLDSDFAKLAREELRKNTNVEDYLKLHTRDDEFTLMFEICHESDPHIIEEKLGVYLIGMRKNYISSRLVDEDVLDREAKKMDALRPNHYVGLFGDIKKRELLSKREGAMIRDVDSGVHLCKLKSNYYKTKKFLMRGKGTIIWNHPQRVDEDFVDVVDMLKTKYTQEQWEELDQFKRREILENMI